MSYAQCGAEKEEAVEIFTTGPNSSALFGQFGRHANDTLCLASAIERRAHYIVDGVMRGILEGSLGRPRPAGRSFMSARAICSLRLGWYAVLPMSR